MKPYQYYKPLSLNNYNIYIRIPICVIKRLVRGKEFRSLKYSSYLSTRVIRVEQPRPLKKTIHQKIEKVKR